MDGLDKMTAAQLRTDPDFRAAFINRIIANRDGRRANRYDDASPRERRQYAYRQLAVFGDIIGADVAARQKEAHYDLRTYAPHREATDA